MEEEKTKCSKMKGQNENGYEDGNEYDVFRRQEPLNLELLDWKSH